MADFACATAGLEGEKAPQLEAVAKLLSIDEYLVVNVKLKEQKHSHDAATLLAHLIDLDDG